MRGGPPGDPNRHTYGPYHVWISTLDCVFPWAARRLKEEIEEWYEPPSQLSTWLERLEEHECQPYDDGDPVKGHHVVPVSRGGRDRGNEVPSCWCAHRLFEDTPDGEIESEYGLDLAAIAELLEADYPEAA